MKEYLIVQGKSIVDLMQQVNIFIKDGWKISGGVALEQDIKENRIPRIKTKYYQAIYR